MKRSSISVRFFGSLYALRRRQGLSTATEIPLGKECKAADLAYELDLPIARLAAIYCNHRLCGLDHPVRPGDRIAFVPQDLPGLRRHLPFLSTP